MNTILRIGYKVHTYFGYLRIVEKILFQNISKRLLICTFFNMCKKELKKSFTRNMIINK